MEATKRQYEEKLTEVKTQLGQGLNTESGQRKTLQEGIKISEEKKGISLACQLSLVEVKDLDLNWIQIHLLLVVNRESD